LFTDILFVDLLFGGLLLMGMIEFTVLFTGLLFMGMIEFLDIKARPVTPRRYRFVLSEDGKWNKQMLSL